MMMIMMIYLSSASLYSAILSSDSLTSASLSSASLYSASLSSASLYSASLSSASLYSAVLFVLCYNGHFMNFYVLFITKLLYILFFTRFTIL